MRHVADQDAIHDFPREKREHDLCVRAFAVSRLGILIYLMQCLCLFRLRHGSYSAILQNGFQLQLFRCVERLQKQMLQRRREKIEPGVFDLQPVQVLQNGTEALIRSVLKLENILHEELYIIIHLIFLLQHSGGVPVHGADNLPVNCRKSVSQFKAGIVICLKFQKRVVKLLKTCHQTIHISDADHIPAQKIIESKSYIRDRNGIVFLSRKVGGERFKQPDIGLSDILQLDLDFRVIIVIKNIMKIGFQPIQNL